MRLLVHCDRPEQPLRILRERYPDLEIACCTDYETLPKALEQEKPEILFTIKFAGPKGFPRAAIIGSPSLRWVSVGGSGTDHLAPWDPSRLIVTNAAGVAAATMAEYALGTALYFTLDLPTFLARQRQRRWEQGPVSSIAGRTIAILGLGRTGQAVATLAKALGLRVLGVRARPTPTPDVERVEPPRLLRDVLREADFVVVCVPLTPQTRHLVDGAAFKSMKPGAVLIDVSRGGVVDQSALLEAIRSGLLKGAALDVFETEPLPSDHPFWAMDNVIVTPHCSGIYDGWEQRSVEMFCDNLDRWRHDLPLENRVDPERGY